MRRPPSLAILALGQHGDDTHGGLAGYDPTIDDTVRKSLDGSGRVTYDAPHGGPRKGGGPGGPDVPDRLVPVPPGVPTDPLCFHCVIAAPPPPMPRGFADPIDVEPDPDLDDSNWRRIREVVQRNLPQLKYCYDEVIKSRPDLAGRVEVEWKITNERVAVSHVVDNATGDDEFGRCVASRVGAWRFADVQDAEVSWPFIFKTGR